MPRVFFCVALASASPCARTSLQRAILGRRRSLRPLAAAHAIGPGRSPWRRAHPQPQCVYVLTRVRRRNIRRVTGTGITSVVSPQVHACDRRCRHPTSPRSGGPHGSAGQRQPRTLHGLHASCVNRLNGKEWSGLRESNPSDWLGKPGHYHYAKPAHERKERLHDTRLPGADSSGPRPRPCCAGA